MPKRIFIRDGGLTASKPAPAGYTVLGSDAGFLKKQITTQVTDAFQIPLSTFNFSSNKENAVYDLSYGNYALIDLGPKFNNVILPNYHNNLFVLNLSSNSSSMDLFEIDINKYTSLQDLTLNFYPNKLLFTEPFIELSGISNLSNIKGVSNPTFSIQNCLNLENVNSFGASSSVVWIRNNPSLGYFSAGGVAGEDSSESLIFEDNFSLSDIDCVNLSKLTSITVSNCPITNFVINNNSVSSSLTSFNTLVNITTVTQLGLIEIDSLTTVDITGMTSLTTVQIVNCALNVGSIENILTNLDSFGLSGGQLQLEGGTNAGFSTWTINANNAKNSLQSKSWSVTYNP